MNLRRLPLEFVLDNWRPGSFDRTWTEEFEDLGSPDRIGEMLLRTWDEHGNPRDELCLQMLRGEPIEPVTLGCDAGFWGGKWWQGRVWAGHHRLWIFHLVARDPASYMVRCDVVEPGGRRGWPANHCAPPWGCIEVGSDGVH